ncbi:MAG: LacI family transcriptional regulator [Candidatus Hydrogenedentes bacterium]|nr:LacI family transcriptional regulator [Candidatus Hydrogenedentota bacterium]
MKTETANKTKRATTTAEIARLCGVSRSTVSAVLNGKPNVREQTRRKVLECLRQGNYASGNIARAFVGRLSRMIAVLASNMGSPFHMMMFRGINATLEAHGYHILFRSVRPEDQDDPETLQNLYAYRPAGYIVLRGAEGPGGVYARRIIEEGVPLVAQGKLVGTESHSIQVDNRAAMKLSAEYVISKGHRRLAYLAGPTFSVTDKERQLGFVEALIEHDIPVSEAVFADAGETAAAGYRAALNLLKNPVTRPTALVCFNDMVAMGTYRAAHELSLDIPGDLSVVGFDGIDFAELLGPPLTTVDTLPHVMGEMTAKLLVRVIENRGPMDLITEWVTPELLERASVRAIVPPFDTRSK